MKCNRDCFNCEFDDCVNDEISIEEYNEQNKMDIVVRNKPKQAKSDRKEYFRQYYMRNKAKMNAQSRKYFQEHKAEIYLQKNARKLERGTNERIK